MTPAPFRVVVVTAAALLFAGPDASAGGSVIAKSAALATASPLATKAGLAILQRGGTAADAAVTVATTLAVAHPQAGNLGGGGFLVYYDAKTGGVWTLDFRETAPRAITREAFAKTAGAARTGALAAGVPGTVAGLGALHERFGRLPWKDLLAPAVGLAHEGVQTTTELSDDLKAANAERNIAQFPATAALFFENGAPRATIAPSELGATLQRLADKGAREFYDGDVAKTIVEGIRDGGGLIGFRDLREYQPVWRAPIKLRYGDYAICTVPPPSGAGLIMGETLNILAADNLRKAGFQTPPAIHLLMEAFRRAFIDRNRYTSDPATQRIPYRELLSKKRAESWRRTIDTTRASATMSLAEPSDLAPEGEHTTHFTIADADGNVIAFTTTLGENFGSGFVVPGAGFLLNNAMDDFTTESGRPNREGLVQGRPNSVDPLKRPASSLAPTIVLRGGIPFLALGTRGGAAIPTTVLEVFLAVAAYGKPIVEAVAAPRYHHQATPDQIVYERGRAPQTTIDALSAMGHPVVPRDAIGDVQAILFENDQLTAVSDPRRGGAAGGY
jgi:gamma-glutamyltranspeptidase/glutathione hydrolase